MQRRTFFGGCIAAIVGLFSRKATAAPVLRHAHRKQKIESATGYREVYRLAGNKLEMIEWEEQRPGDLILCIDVNVGGDCDRITGLHAHVCRSVPDRRTGDKLVTVVQELNVDSIALALA